MDAKDMSRFIHDAHEHLASGYGHLDGRGQVQANTLEDWNYRRNVQEPISRIVAEHVGRTGFTVLDAGCGNGQLFHLYSQLGAKAIYGVDFGRSMLRHAILRAKENSIAFVPILAGLEDLACIPDASLDVANLYGVIEHLPDPVDVLNELSRVLRPQGVVIVAVPRKRSLAWATYFLFCPSLAEYAGDETWWERLTRQKKMSLYKFYTKKDIRRILGQVHSLHLVQTLPIAYGGVVGPVDKPLRKAALKGSYARIDQWNILCRKLHLVPAGEYLVLLKV
jgi:2-polyprenyl-3-methyl-5-hydroxy-6-metoxy-1,4-benzoquinol methylase